MIAGLLLLLAGVALAGLAALLLARRPLPAAPLLVHMLAAGLCLGVLVLLKGGGWPDMGERVFGAGLALLAPWLAVALLASAWRPAPVAAAFAAAGAWRYAGFFLALGLASLRNLTPLAPPLAWAAILFGLLLLLAPTLAQPLASTGRRAGALLAMLLLLGAGCLLGAGFQARADRPFGVFPAGWAAPLAPPQILRPPSGP